MTMTHDELFGVTPDELFGVPDPETVRKTEYVQAAHYVRTSLFARLKSSPHRSALAAHAVWAGGHYRHECGLDDAHLAPSTAAKLEGGWNAMAKLDNNTLNIILKAARACSAKAPTKSGAEVANGVVIALQAILAKRHYLKSKGAAPSPSSQASPLVSSPAGGGAAPGAAGEEAARQDRFFELLRGGMSETDALAVLDGAGAEVARQGVSM